MSPCHCQPTTYLVGVTVLVHLLSKRKLSGFTLLKKELRYQEAFQMLGQSHDVPESTKIAVEEFICHFREMKVTSVSELRYLPYPITLKEEKVDPICYLQVKHALSSTYLEPITKRTSGNTDWTNTAFASIIFRRPRLLH